MKWAPASERGGEIWETNTTTLRQRKWSPPVVTRSAFWGSEGVPRLDESGCASRVSVAEPLISRAAPNLVTRRDATTAKQKDTHMRAGVCPPPVTWSSLRGCLWIGHCEDRHPQTSGNSLNVMKHEGFPAELIFIHVFVTHLDEQLSSGTTPSSSATDKIV